MKKRWKEVLIIEVLLSLILVPLFFHSSWAQPQRLIPIVSAHFTWNTTFGGIAYEEGTAIVETTDGGFAIAGRSASFGAVVGVDEAWMVRCDQHGVHLWNHTYGGEFKIGGHLQSFHKSVDIDQTAGGGFLLTSHTTRNSVGGADGWLIRTDADGNHLWNYTYGGPDDEYLVQTVICSAGGFICGGITQNESIGNTDAWLLRTDIDGNHLWNYTYGGPAYGEVCYDLIEVSSGGFLLAGFTGDFEHLEDPAMQTVDVGCWLVRVDMNGNQLWSQTIGTQDFCTNVVECQSGGFALTGISGDPASQDILLLRTDSDGFPDWNKTYGGSDIEAAFAFTECNAGGFAIFGLTYTDAWGTSDGWFIRTDSDGNILWEQTYGGNNFDQFWTGIITMAGDFVMVGLTTSFGTGVGDMWAVRIPDVPPLGLPPPILLWIYGAIAVVLVVIIVIVLLLYRRRS
jgi:hypothetical protein